MLAAQQRVLVEVCQGRGGRVLAAGDVVEVAFDRAVDAQRALASHPWPEDISPKVRVGIHTAAPTADAPRSPRATAEAATRVAVATHGGQVLLTAATAGAITTPPPGGLALRDLGAWPLPGLARPVGLHQLVVPGLPADFPPPRVAAPRPTRLPVCRLPRVSASLWSDGPVSRHDDSRGGGHPGS